MDINLLMNANACVSDLGQLILLLFWLPEVSIVSTPHSRITKSIIILNPTLGIDNNYVIMVNKTWYLNLIDRLYYVMVVIVLINKRS